jgi:hypothetical protein
MYVLNCMQGKPIVCDSRDEALKLFFESPDVYDFFENKKSILFKRGSVIYVLEDVCVPNGLDVWLERVVLTESISNMSHTLLHFVSRTKLVRVEANSFNMSEVLETLSVVSNGHVLVDYLDDESTSSF